MQVETLEMQLTSSDILEQQQEQLQQQQQHLQRLIQQQTEHASAAVKLHEQCQQLQQQIGAVDHELLLLQKQQSDLQQKVRQAAADATAGAAELTELKLEMKQLRSNFPDSEVVQDLAASVHIGQHDGNFTSRNDSKGDLLPAKQTQQALRKVKQLQQQILSLEVPELPAAQKEICGSRVQQVLQFREQMAALEAAADGLEERISSTTEQVILGMRLAYELLDVVCTIIVHVYVP